MKKPNCLKGLLPALLCALYLCACTSGQDNTIFGMKGPCVSARKNRPKIGKTPLGDDINVQWKAGAGLALLSFRLWQPSCSRVVRTTIGLF